jgi:hypothetical protein
MIDPDEVESLGGDRAIQAEILRKPTRLSDACLRLFTAPGFPFGGHLSPNASPGGAGLDAGKAWG